MTDPIAPPVEPTETPPVPDQGGGGATPPARQRACSGANNSY